MKDWVIIFIVSLFCSCNFPSNSGNKSKPNTNFNLLVNHEDSMDFVIQSYGSNKLNLSSLTKGVDSFEMRLWFSDELTEETPRQNVVIVKKSKEEWLFTETTYWATVRNDTASNGVYNFDIDSSKTKKLQPPATEVFIDSLMYYTKGLANSKDLEGTVSMYRQGTRHIFEVATKSFYKFFPYNCGTVRNKGATHEKMRKFLNFLSSQLSINIPACTK